MVMSGHHECSITYLCRSGRIQGMRTRFRSSAPGLLASLSCAVARDGSVGGARRTGDQAGRRKPCRLPVSDARATGRRPHPDPLGGCRQTNRTGESRCDCPVVRDAGRGRTRLPEAWRVSGVRADGEGCNRSHAAQTAGSRPALLRLDHSGRGFRPGLWRGVLCAQAGRWRCAYRSAGARPESMCRRSVTGLRE